MLIARDENDKPIWPSKGVSGFCPLCKSVVHSKTGDVNTWHFAHKAFECDKWKENESDWHIRWKTWFGLDNCEKVVGEHRADIVVDDTVIEIQNSSISQEDAIKREDYYISKGYNFIWILNGHRFSKNFSFRIDKDDNKIFKWSRVQSSFNRSWPKMRVFIDFESHIKKSDLDKEFMPKNFKEEPLQGKLTEIVSYTTDSELTSYEVGFGKSYDHLKYFFVGEYRTWNITDFMTRIWGF
jgi:hypothetical protein